MRNDIINRTDSIDFLKAICAFLIICIHAPFPGEVGSYFTALARIAVPIFFMISGFFYNKEKLVGQIKKITILFISSNLLYVFWSVVYGFVSGNHISVTIKSMLKFVLLNDSPFGGHLWYLGAILYVLLIVLVVEKINLMKLLYAVTPILLLGDLVLGKYAILIWGREFSYILVRNFIFVGIPYFTIGMMMKEKKLRLSGWTIPIFILTTFCERFLLVSLNANAARDHYLSTTFLAIAVMSAALGYKGHVLKFGVRIGRDYSTWIYIVHPIFIACFGWFFSKIGLYGVYKYFAPVYIYIVSAIFVEVGVECWKKTKKR